MAKASPAEVQKYLEGISYPQDKDALVEYARSKGAPDDVIETLEGLSGGDYGSPTEVSEEVM